MYLKFITININTAFWWMNLIWQHKFDLGKIAPVMCPGNYPGACLEARTYAQAQDNCEAQRREPHEIVCNLVEN